MSPTLITDTLPPKIVTSTRIGNGDGNRDNHGGLLAQLAKQALVAEAELTPKPGLVDRRGPGSHDDLSLAMMLASAQTLEPFFQAMSDAASTRRPCRALFDELQQIGLLAECAMYATTGGVNTHKGAIWTLGLLVSACTIQLTSDCAPDSITSIASRLASYATKSYPARPTHGRLVEQKYSVTGARGEACMGFPHVKAYGIPVLRLSRSANKDETTAKLDALMSLMTKLDDTCLLYRGGRHALTVAQTGASGVLNAGGSGTRRGFEKLLRLHEELLRLKCSPGGSADLLAATLFLDAATVRNSLPSLTRI